MQRGVLCWLWHCPRCGSTLLVEQSAGPEGKAAHQRDHEETSGVCTPENQAWWTERQARKAAGTAGR